MSYASLFLLLAPETLLVVVTLGLLFVDLTTLRGESAAQRVRWAVGLTVLGCAAAASALFLVPTSLPPEMARDLGGMIVPSAITRIVKLILLGLTAATALVSLGSRFTPHAGEYYGILLLATIGMMFLAGTENLLLIFVSLELLSLSLYILTAFHKSNARSAEAALKYFLFGGISAACLLFGFSLLYGLSGQLELGPMAARLSAVRTDPLLLLALLLVLVGLGFKIAAVPFHLWAPDVYQGAPLPSAILIATGSKVASFFILAKIGMVGFSGVMGQGGWLGQGSWHQFTPGWAPLLALTAALSVVLGNLAAIVQTSVRRLLAYSAIAHAGYLLVGLLATQKSEGMASVLFYVTTYALTTVGAFAVVSVVEEATGNDRLESFAGFGSRSPLLAFCLMILLLSLAGIPPLAGFFGKFFLFKAGLFTAGAAGANPLGLLWLVALGLALSAVSLYYYLQVLKQVYVVRAPEASDQTQRTLAPLGIRVVVGMIAAIIVVTGCMPNLLLQPLQAAIKSSGF